MLKAKKEKAPTRLSAFYQDNKFVFLSALVSLLIFLLIAFCYDLVPFGDMTILRMDLYHQYGPLFAELYDRLTSGESLIYSWNSGLGSSFLGNFFNYLSSPLTIIILLFGHKNITEAISCLIMLKAVLSAASFTYYLKASQKQHSYTTAAFGVLYAFCGYFVAYYWNLMWLDAMVIFPIIILGIERIINKGKPALYCLSLTLMIFANYYMAYMVCLFSVLYFLTYYAANYPFSKKFSEIYYDTPLGRIKNSLFISSGLKFAFSSIVAVLLASAAIFPLVAMLSQSSATSGSSPTGFTKYFTAFDFLANHLASTDATIRSSGNDVLPNVYCGILTLLLVPLYLFSKKISTREKISYVSLLAVLYFSFNINYLNFVWHGLHFPNDLPYRFSFMYSFVLLILAFKAFTNIKEYTGRQLLGVGIGLIAFIILVEKTTSKNIDDISLIISLVFAVGYVVILHFFKDKRFQSSSLSLLLLCCVVSEVALGNTDNYSMNQSKTNYVAEYDQFQDIKAKIDEYDNNGFYRMELTKLKTRMDPCWLDYNGVSVFSSMAYETVANLQQNLGLYGNYINSYTYNPQTPVYNAMFGIKYIADNQKMDINPNLYEDLFANDKFTAYKNKYDLSVAFAADSLVKYYDSSIYGNPFEAQQQLFNMATGVDNVFTKLTIDDAAYSNINDFYPNEFESGEFKFSKPVNDEMGSVSFVVTPQETQNIYIYIKSNAVDSATVSGSIFNETYTSLDEAYIIDLGIINAGEAVNVDIAIKDTSNRGTLNFYAYSLNEEAFKAGYEKLKKGDYNITEYSDTKLTGTITASENSAVFTSIPYDINWNVYIDGRRLKSDEIYKISNGLLGFDIEAGEHTVVFSYVSSGLLAGSFVSIATILIATISIIVNRKRKKKKQKVDKWLMLNEAPVSVSVPNESDTFEIDFDSIEEQLNANEIKDEPPTAENQNDNEQ